MIRRRITFAAIGIVLWASAAVAQPSPIHAAVDIPAPNSVWAYGMLYIAGWNLNCYTGQQVPEVNVYYVPDGNLGPLVAVRDAQVVWRLVRPDVQAAAPGMCYAADVPWVVPATAHVGFAVFFPTPIPRGSRTLVVQFTDTAVYPTTDASLGTRYIQRIVTVQ